VILLLDDQPGSTWRALWKKIIGGSRANGHSLTDDEIRNLIEASEEDGVINKQEGTMIQNILDFGDTTVSDIMVPRTDIRCVEIKSSLDEIIDLVVLEGFSRIPVYKENLDNIIGIIYSKDLLHLWGDNKLIILNDIIRPPFFVPETKKISQLLLEFKRRRIHMSIVLDEYGGTAGLVTLEDIIEEIVGEIQDEFDTEELEYEELSDGGYVFKGSMPLKEINDNLKFDFQFPEEEFVTISGFVCHLFSKIPVSGETIQHQDLNIEVLESDKRKVIQVRIRENRITDTETENNETGKE
jgi:hemolysin (HlyC) family protein